MKLKRDYEKLKKQQIVDIFVQINLTKSAFTTIWLFTKIWLTETFKKIT